jgi:hypothetical protein
VWEEGRGRSAKVIRRDANHQPISVKELSLNLPASTWRKVWREGVAAPFSTRFARVRVRAAHRDYKLTEPYPEEWLLVEWPKGEKEPTKYWLSTLPDDIGFLRLVDHAKLRWRIEHDYKELKQEVGLGDFEGRGWRGFHHHATMPIAVYGFLISERGASPLSINCQSSLPGTCPAQRLSTPRLRRCGLSVTSRTHHATTPDCQARRHFVALPMLCSEVKAAFSPQS